MPCQQLRGVLPLGGQGIGDPAVDLAALAAQQGLVGGILDQGVLEHVGQLVARAAPYHKTRGDEVGQRRVEAIRRQIDAALEQRRRENPPDGRSDLGHMARAVDAVEPGHQRVVERCRHRRRLTAGSARRALRDRAGDLLDEQRNAVRPVDDPLDDLRRQAGCHLRDDCSGFRRRQWPQRELGRVRQADPGRPALGPEGRHHEDPEACHRSKGQLEQFARGRVDPVGVLEHQEHWRMAGEPGELGQQRPEQAALALSRRQRGDRIRRVGETQQVRHRRQVRRRIDPAAVEDRPQPLQAPRRVGLALQTRRVDELLGDRPQRRRVVER